MFTESYSGMVNVMERSNVKKGRRECYPTYNLSHLSCELNKAKQEPRLFVLGTSVLVTLVGNVSSVEARWVMGIGR